MSEERMQDGAAAHAADGALIARVEAAIDRMRPALVADGGNCELVDVRDGVVQLRLVGACGGCPMSQLTLKQGLERIIREDVPEIQRVEAV
jgi:Fe-S cluster biogenesis protein NfuA